MIARNPFVVGPDPACSGDVNPVSAPSDGKRSQRRYCLRPRLPRTWTGRRYATVRCFVLMALVLLPGQSYFDSTEVRTLTTDLLVPRRQ